MMLLSFFARKITGVDADPRELERAKRLDYFCPVDMVEMDLDKERLTEKVKEADVVTCFETLEHLTNPGMLLYEITQLKPKRFIFSLPHNAPRESDKNPWSIHYGVYRNVNDVCKLLSPYFDNFTIYQERNMLVADRFITPHRYLGICT